MTTEEQRVANNDRAEAALKALGEAVDTLRAVAPFVGRYATLAVAQPLRDRIARSALLAARALVGSENRSAPETTHRVECRECDAVAELRVADGNVTDLNPMNDWEFSLDTGWLCPKHAAARGSSVRTQESASEAK